MKFMVKPQKLDSNETRPYIGIAYLRLSMGRFKTSEGIELGIKTTKE